MAFVFGKKGEDNVVFYVRNSSHLCNYKIEHKMKDTRITYKTEKMEVNGTFLTFDGKGDVASKELKIYRLYGDINQSAEAIQNFCLENGYERAVTLF